MDLNLFIAPVVLVLVEAVKRTEKVSTKVLPLVALGLGLVIGVVFALVDQEQAVLHVVNGFLYGAAAAGLYDAAKVPTKL